MCFLGFGANNLGWGGGGDTEQRPEGKSSTVYVYCVMKRKSTNCVDFTLNVIQMALDPLPHVIHNGNVLIY